MSEQGKKALQRRTDRPVTTEDAREVTANLVKLFELLIEWDEEDEA